MNRRLLIKLGVLASLPAATGLFLFSKLDLNSQQQVQILLKDIAPLIKQYKIEFSEDLLKVGLLQKRQTPQETYLSVQTQIDQDLQQEKFIHFNQVILTRTELIFLISYTEKKKSKKQS